MNNVITLSELKPGMILFFHGIKFLAKRIHFFQWLKYPEKYIIFNGQKFYFYLLNHVGILDKNIDNDFLIYQQDNPGRFQIDRLDEEFLKEKGDIWIGISKITDEALLEGMRGLRKEAELLAGEDCILNYSYKSFIGFMFDSVYFKLFNREFWITGQPKGTTCSQITAFLCQKHFGMFDSKEWFKFYPAELAMSPEIDLKKLIYS